MRRLSFPALSANTLILATAAFITVSGNLTLFGKLFAAYPWSAHTALPLLTMPLALVAFTTLLLAPWCFGGATRVILAAGLVIAALAGHFIDRYGVVINDDMLRNVLQTNVAEATDLASIRLFVVFTALGLLPAILVWKTATRNAGWRKELLARLKLIAICVAILLATIFGSRGFFVSLAREHKALRTYVNPGYAFYSAGRLLKASISGPAAETLERHGEDARLPADDPHRELVVLVVGETARSDRFALNGYRRDTNPRLAKEDVVSFTNFWSCGTSTGISVPCMFSLFGEANFDEARARRQENVLDVLQRAGVFVLWLDNNYDSKGVADRVRYESYRHPDKNARCDEECRDEGMLDRLPEIIDAQKSGDIVIILHQMGNHGPAYHKRYPPQWEVFKPVCRSSDLSLCTGEEIDNAYDNAVLYTDHFLGQVIDLLKKYDGPFETAMFYVSDHGESLGEKGTYLHGLPKSIAPDAQSHVPAVMWFGRHFRDLDLQALSKRRDVRLTHDHLSHTLLGFVEAETSVYRRELDILDGVRTLHPEIAKARSGAAAPATSAAVAPQR